MVLKISIAFQAFNMDEAHAVLWIYDQKMNRMFLMCAIASFISINCNTPETFKEQTWLQYITLIVDAGTGVALTVEVYVKLKSFLAKNDSFFQNGWCLFDACMVIFIWISVIIQIVEMCLNLKGYPLGVARIPRALILLRVFRYSNFQLERGRLRGIVYRVGQQIGGVTLFLLFFLLLYGLLGVQLFGTMSFHCVMNGTDPNNVTLRDLAIPDTLCSCEDFSMCPPNFICKNISLTLEERGYGGFDNIFVSIKTVYEAASQEGWIFLMYKNIDSYTDWHSYVYFPSLIFFLAWLVKNVFIAVIIETFAEIRVQLNNLWGNSRYSHPGNTTHYFGTLRKIGFQDFTNVAFTALLQVIMNDGRTMLTAWKMVDVNMKKPNQDFKDRGKQALHSRWYHITMLSVIVVNVAIHALISRTTRTNWDFFHTMEVIFTVIFDVEAVAKIMFLGIRGYFKRSIYQYEALLALMTTINAAFYVPVLRSFPVFRIIRLVKLSPSLENFVYKIFGPAKKIGLLVFFTLSMLTLMSTISLQMLCYVDNLEYFSTFPRALMSMFQIMTQEGWIDVMQEAMNDAGPKALIPVLIYFILYHLFVTTVLMSLFVAVILDNLELDENLKRLKQLKVNEQRVDMKQPLRLRVFEYFPNKPEMVHLSKMPGEFVLPRLRDSFLRQFIDTRSSGGLSTSASRMTGVPSSLHSQFSPLRGVVASTVVATRLAIPQDAFASSVKIEDWTENLGIPVMNLKRDVLSKLLRRQMRLIKKKDDGSLKIGRSLYLGYKHQGITTADNGLMKPTIVKTLIDDCSPKSTYTGDSGLLINSTTAHCTSLLGTQHMIRRERRSFPAKRRTFYDENQQIESDSISTSDSLYNRKAQEEVDFKLLHVKRQQAILKRQRQEQELRENHPFFDTPLFLVKRGSNFRKFCRTLVYSQYGKFKNKPGSDVNEHGRIQVLYHLLGLVSYLDWIMILVTVTSCCSMMMESTTRHIHDTFSLQITEYVFVVAMGLELLLKVFANGLFFTPKPTFKDLGGLLDAMIFLVSLIFVFNLQGPSGQVLMVLRSLRPLRIFKLVPQIKKVVVEMLRGFKEICMVGILLAALMFVFACFGVQLYGGQLAACNDDMINKKEDCKGIFYQKVWISNSLDMDDNPPGFMVPRVWTNPRNFNFDTIGSAMLTLFEVLSLKGWVEVRDILIKRVGAGHALYIHFFVFLGCMMGLTLFIGVVIANYNENKGTALLTVDQRRWEDLKSRVKIAQPLHLPPRPPGGIRAKMYDCAEHTGFKFVIACCVMARSLLLSLKWESTYDYAKYLSWLSVFFTFVFGLEMIIKVIGMTFCGMMRSWRNRYDFIVTLFEIGWVVLFLANKDKEFVYSFGWILVAFRFFSICGRHATLKMLLMTVAVSVYRSFFIIVAMFLLLLCYAYAGVVLFGNVKYGENIDRHANFSTVPLAVVVLFRIVTGEDWNKIMHDCMIQPPRCTPSQGGNYWDTDCGNVLAARVYFCSFYIIIAYIMLNLLVAIIVENFSLFYTMDEDILLSYKDLHMFQVHWNEVDQKRKGAIDVKSVKDVLSRLTGRLQINTTRDHLLLKHMCLEMEKLGRRSASTANRFNGTNSNGLGHGGRSGDETLYVTFHDVLMMTAYRSVDIRKSLQLKELLMREKLEVEIERQVAKEIIEKWLVKCIRRNRERIHCTTDHAEPMRPTIMVPPVEDPIESIITTESRSEQVDGKESDDPEGEFDLNKTKYAKAGKHRRHGLWKSPPSYLPGAAYTGCLPSLKVEDMVYDDANNVESCRDHTSTEVSTNLDKWWDDIHDNLDDT